MPDNNHPKDADVSKILSEHYENVEMDESYKRELLSNMLSATAPRRRRLPVVRWLIGAAAAAVFVLAYIGVAHVMSARANANRLYAVVQLHSPVVDRAGHKLKVGDYVAAGEVVRTGRGGRVTLVARNGSLIRLDQCSKLVLDTKGEVTVNKGRLYCSNRMHEIKTIGTPAGSIRLLGTVLDASVINKDTAAVTVVQGKVELSNSHGVRIVGEGNRAVMAASLAPEEGSPINTAQETAWYEGRNSIVSDTGEIAYLVHRSKDVPRKMRYVISELWAMKSDGSDKHLVATFMGQYNQLGSWCPGGQWVLMTALSAENVADPARPVSSTFLRLVNVSTGQDIYLPLPADFNLDISAHPLGCAAVSPDGKKIAITATRERNCLFETSWNSSIIEGGIWIYNTESNELKLLIPGDKYPVPSSYTPAWSPDSRLLTISESNGIHKPETILLADTQTGTVRHLAKGSIPVFSPDGKRLAYCESTYSPKDGPKGPLCVIDVEGNGEPRQISPEIIRPLTLTWSPDGSKVTYVADEYREHSYVIRAAEADGSGVHDIYAAKGQSEGIMSWGRDGEALYIRTYDGILKVAADGSGLIARLGGDENDSILSDEASEQLAQVRSVVGSREDYYGRWRIFQGRLGEGRKMLREYADKLSELPWKYPLVHISIPDVTYHADAAAGFASLSNKEALSIACNMCIVFTRMGLETWCRGKKNLPQDTEALKKFGMFGMTLGDLPDARVDGLSCPGKYQSHPVPFIYTPPKNGVPKIGDPIFQCPNHHEHKIVWDKELELWRNLPPLKPIVKK